MATATIDAVTTNDAALQTLTDIQQYVMPARFSLSSLARGLMRMGHSEKLLVELTWLVAHEYLVKDVTCVYDLTPKGRLYEPPPKKIPTDETPMFDFLAATPVAEEEDRRDPRDRRR